MTKKRTSFPFSIKFVSKIKSLRRSTTDDTKLGARKSGATLDQILRSLRSPSRRLNNRMAPAEVATPDRTKANNRVAGVIALIVFVVIVGCTQMARNGFRDVGKTIHSAANEAGRSFSGRNSSTNRAVADRADRTSPSNREISDRVEQALLEDDHLGLSDLSVETAGGVVTLRGKVISEVQNQRAEHIARATVGTGYTVDDLLVIG